MSKIEQKGMTFLILFPFLFPPKKEGRRKGELAKIVIKGHDFLLDPIQIGSNYVYWELGYSLL